MGEEWEKDIEMYSKGYVQEYLNHIEDFVGGCDEGRKDDGKDQAVVLIAAHVFTQSMAVASGGQMLSSIISKSLGLESHRSGRDGLETFYFNSEETEHSESKKHSKDVAANLKDRLKAVLDQDLYSALTQWERDAFIREHCEVFQLNNKIISSFRVGYIAPVRSFFVLSCRQAYRWRVLVFPILVAILLHYFFNKSH